MPSLFSFATDYIFLFINWSFFLYIFPENSEKQFSSQFPRFQGNVFTIHSREKISANYRYVETLHFVIWQLYVSFGSSFYLLCDNAVFMPGLRVGTKTHLVKVGKRSCFGQKYLIVIASNVVGDVLGSRYKSTDLLPQPQLDCYSRAHEHVM